MVANQKTGLGLRLMLWLVTTLALFSALSASGLAPFDVRDLISGLFNAFVQSGENPAMANTGSASAPKPDQTKIIIRRLDIASPIVFPTSTDLEKLKIALDQGVVHYPLSAFPNESIGNVFIFGHSSSRPFEKNPARTAFTRLNELEAGNEIELQYSGRSYRYRVISVKILKPWQAEVYFATQKRMLTLSTCWPIGDPSNRFVVEAEFVKSYPLMISASSPDTSS